MAFDRPVLDHAIAFPRSDKGAEGSGDLRLWTGSDLCVLALLDCGVSTLGDTCQLDQRSRWNGSELAQTRALENSEERGGTVQKN